MLVFLARLSIFLFLWLMLIVQESTFPSLSLLFLTISLIFYFFLSVRRHSIWLFIILFLLLIGNYFFVDRAFYTFTLFLYLTIFATFRLKEKLLYIFIALHYIFFLMKALIDAQWIEQEIIMYSSIVFLSIGMHRLIGQRNKQKEKLEELEATLRTLNRRHISMEEAARIEERTRIMRDLHDSVGHQLTALIMKTEMYAIQTGDEKFRKLKQMAESSLEETRKAVSVLKNDESEGIATVVQLIRKLESESHMIVQFTLKEGVLATRLSNTKNIQLYRIIQEALTNAMRHSDTREVQVILGKTAINHLSLEVRNRIHEVKPFTFGFGLTNMEKRLKEMNGELSVYQTEGEFVVKGSFPIEEGCACGEY